MDFRFGSMSAMRVLVKLANLLGWFVLDVIATSTASNDVCQVKQSINYHHNLSKVRNIRN